MSPILQSRKKKTGASPGTLVHIGKPYAGPVRVECFLYDAAQFEEVVFTDPHLFFTSKFSHPETITDPEHPLWINVEGVHETEIVREIGERFGLHPLVLEDIVNTDQRPKMEEYGDHLYLVLRMLRYDGKKECIFTEQVSLLIGKGYLISFQEGLEGDVFEAVRKRIREARGVIRSLRTDFLAYSLIDVIVDHYFDIMEKVGERIEKLEDEILESPSQHSMREIHRLKREMIILRRSVWPLRELLSGLTRCGTGIITDATRPFFRDVYDHTIQVMDTVETYRDLLAGMIDMSLSSNATRQNEVMKVLTMIATLFMPLTFLVGVYGMNFKYFPEIHWKWGYPAVWVLVFIITGGMVTFFRKKGWW